jgi:hypothetical protein
MGGSVSTRYGLNKPPVVIRKDKGASNEGYMRYRKERK